MNSRTGILLPAAALLVGWASVPAPTLAEAALAAVEEAAQGSATLRFVVVGDTQGSGGVNSAVWPAMVDDMNAHAPAFVLFCGDLVSGGSTASQTIAQWQDWKTRTAGLTGTRYMTPGNHDFYGGTSFADWRAAFPWLPTSNSPVGEEGGTYWFDAGNVRVVSVATDYPGGGGPPNQAWLDGVLSASTGVDHVFVFSHRPVMFSNSEPTGGSGGPLWQSLVQNDVAGYFSGHWHRYQPDRITAGARTFETVIGTGGGWQGYQPIRPYQQRLGYLLVEVNGLDVTGTFYGDEDSDGDWDDPLDSYVFRQAAPEPEGLVAEYTFESGDASDTAPGPLGKQVHGALKGGATVGPGLSGNHALDLGGGGAHVEAGHIGDYNLSINGDLTVSAFAEYRALAPGAWDNPLLCYGTADYYTEDEETNYSYWLSLRADRHLVGFWEHLDGSDILVTSSVPAPVAPGETHHYAMTRDSATMRVRFWVDGQQLGSAVPFGALPTSGARGMLYLGADVAARQAAGEEFDGLLDDVRIHNRVLSQQEIAALAAPVPPPPTLSVPLLHAGQAATLVVENAAPGSPVAFGASLTGGGPLTLNGGPCGGLTLALSAPLRPLAFVTADAGGVATLATTVPPALAGRTVWLQAVDTTGCRPTPGFARVVL